MRRRLRIILPILAVGAAAVAWGLISDGRRDGVLILSGNIEVVDARLGFKIAGRLLERLVDEGVDVEGGQLLARLDPADQQLAVSLAEANLAYSQAALGELEAGSRPEEIRRSEAQLEQARYELRELENGSRVQEIADATAERDRAAAAIDAAKTRFALARLEDERTSKLAIDGVASQGERDAARTQRQAAEADLEEAQARLRSAEERLSLVKEGTRTERIDKARAALGEAEANYALVKAGTREETIDKARAQVSISRESLRRARQDLEYTGLVAPFAGVVLSKAAEPGEYLQPGAPVVTVGDLDHVWLRAYVNEADLGRIRLGQEASVTVDTYPGRVFRGRVSFVASEAEFTPKSVETHAERVKLTYRIKIDVQNPGRVLKPGMPADAEVVLAEGPAIGVAPDHGREGGAGTSRDSGGPTSSGERH